MALPTGPSHLVLRRWDKPRAKPGGTQRHPGRHDPNRVGHRIPRRLPSQCLAGPRRRISGCRSGRGPAARPEARRAHLPHRGLVPGSGRAARPGGRRHAFRRRRPGHRRAAGPLGRGRHRRCVDPSVPGDDRGQRGRPRTGSGGARRPRGATVQATGAPTQGLGLTISLDVGYRLAPRGRRLPGGHRGVNPDS